MQRNSRLVLLGLAVGLLVLTAGCLSAVSSDDAGGLPAADADVDDMSAAELQAEVVAVMEDVDTAEIEIGMEIEATGQSIEMTGDGEMDATAEKMRMDMEMAFLGQTIEMEQYTVGETAYNYIPELDQWEVEDLSDQPGGIWDDGQFGAIDIEAVADLSLGDTTTIDGHEVQQIDAEVDWETMQQVMTQQGVVDDELTEQDIDIDEFDMTMAVDTETLAVRQTEVSFSAVEGGEEVEMTMTMTYDEFNTPVDIDVPDDAPVDN